MGDSFDAPPPPPPAIPPPPPPPPPPSGGTPWEERDRLGIAVALVETIKRVLLDPVAFFKGMPVSGGIGGPLVFGLIVCYFGLVVSAVYDAVFQSVAGTMFSDFTRRSEFQRFAGLFEGGIGLGVTLVLGPLLLLVGLFLGAGITHLFLMLLGGAKRDFEATFRVTCFVQAAAVFAVLPFCGNLVQFVYQIVLAIIGLSEVHQTGKWTAAGAVLLPGLLLCCCCVGILAAMFGGIASLSGLPR